MLCLFGFPALALAQTPASPSPSPSPTPMPAVSWQTNVSGYSLFSTSPSATRTDVSNLMVTLTRNTGVFRYGATVGAYAFPTVGRPLVSTFTTGANTDLFGYVPIAYIAYVPNASWTFSAGKQATLIGQESGFTWQNVTIERGLGWLIEPTVSRGIRASYTHAKFTGIAEYNDGFYSGHLSAFEGSFSWKASDVANYTIAFILPKSDTAGNPTTSIANQRIVAAMTTQTFGKLTLTPYLQWVDSPQALSLGYNGDERAFYAVMMGNYVFSPTWSLAARYERAQNRSATLDTGLNADLVGFGPGSDASTFTLTPALTLGHTMIRAEYANVHLGTFAPGLGFGSNGRDASQSRFGLELGFQW